MSITLIDYRDLFDSEIITVSYYSVDSDRLHSININPQVINQSPPLIPSKTSILKNPSFRERTYAGKNSKNAHDFSIDLPFSLENILRAASLDYFDDLLKAFEARLRFSGVNLKESKLTLRKMINKVKFTS